MQQTDVFPLTEMDILESDNWPQQLDVERSGPSGIVITLADSDLSQ